MLAQPYVMYENCTQPCTPLELRLALPSVGNKAGVARGNSTTFSADGPPPLHVASCPAGGCPPNWLSYGDPLLTGYDIDVAELVFVRMLGLNITYRVVHAYDQMLLALMQGYCDVALSTTNDPKLQACDEVANPANFTAVKTFDYGYHDYFSGSVTEATEDPAIQVRCIAYGSPVSGDAGFALLSRITTKPFDIGSAVFNHDILNLFSILLIMSMSAGFLVHLLERKNMHLGTVSRGAYWSIMTLLTFSENEPVRKRARVVFICYALGLIAWMNVLGSVMGAKITTTTLSMLTANTLSGVQGALCVEAYYTPLNDFLSGQSGVPNDVRYEDIGTCVDLLMAGEVGAIVTDSTGLAWRAKHLGLQGVYLSPVLTANPSAWAYSSTSAKSMLLRSYVEPAIIAATVTDADWTPKLAQIQRKYFGLQDPNVDLGQNPISYGALIAGLTMFCFALVCSVLNGDVGPGIFRNATTGWRAARVGQALSGRGRRLHVRQGRRPARP